MATFSTRSLSLKLLSRRYVPLSHVVRNHNSHFTSIKQALLGQQIDKQLSIKGWIKNIQQHKGTTFLQVSDGSGPQLIQVVVPDALAQTVKLTFGSCVHIEGLLKQSPAKGQSVELLSSVVSVVGSCDPFDFPLKMRARHPPQYTRDFLHVRPKTNIFGALLRIRNVASMAVHSFFQSKGYLFIHTPILTSSDCEGACEVFKVEPLKSDILTSSWSSDSDEDEMSRGPQNRQSAGESHPAPQADSKENHFFNQPVFLTVSGQLHLEVMTGAFTKVYNFGPAFRAENSHGSFHLSEFYMVEAELAFIESLDPLLHVMEELVKYVCKSVLDECSDDMNIFAKFSSEEGHMSRINKIVGSTFERLTYTDAIHILENSKQDFEFKVSWGCDLKKEHELYLNKAVGNIPVFITNYPSELKPFYARRNQDGLTVSASDLLMPGVGELCGSSLREERADRLQEVMLRQKLLEQMKWYLDLRKFGSCPHGGFGLGFERLLMALVGAKSLKDVIPFPRWPKRCST